MIPPSARQILEKNKLTIVFLLGTVGVWTWLYYPEREVSFDAKILPLPLPPTSSSRSSQENTNAIALTRAQVASVSQPDAEDEVDPSKVKIMTWNIQGLLFDSLDKRTDAVISEVQKENPDVMFFQEFIGATYEKICRALKKYYGCIRGRQRTQAGYFVGILYKKTRFVLEDHEKVPFQKSVMDRLLLVVKVYLKGHVKTKLALMTSHLESLPKFSIERKNQLKESFIKGSSLPKEYNVIFGGDLNLEKGEEDGIIPDDFKDLWIACGSSKRTMYTWDTIANENDWNFDGHDPRQRYDRLYFRASQPATMQPIELHLGGKDPVEGTSFFPSDHWAVISTFKLISDSDSKNSSEQIRCTVPKN